ncbi:MAG: hypothetical protein AUJ23_01160 [Candidatus Magasanikbacteria bacterium CG1_02_32_51]|uniref:Methyltransferase FkbM domain-containing protein n=1 Tax=Candidatus Magasanikbacteria bacterium CG1_02_32_51 TaxID=1805238 RepID=A0A1J4U7P6_9BACT|nr:MAG: hypothetical protein AUJ23_01160 [Candidatus Magasanikbacteria bacterium CG1_02_32_51]
MFLNKKALKKFIKTIFWSFGYRIDRVPFVKKSKDELLNSLVGKYHIFLTGDSQLPLYLRNPMYSTNLPRLVKVLNQKYQDLIMIDVGANVGDTVALTKSVCDIPIVCIEGGQDYFNILKKNIVQFKNIYAFQYFFGDKNGSIGSKLVKNNETARIINSDPRDKGTAIQVITLDNFLELNSKFKNAKILKIDTDGYDLKILRGGINYIGETKPVLFFEYDTVYFLEQKDSGIDMFKRLESLGYSDIIFYDNGGKIIISCKLGDHLLLRQLDNYIDKDFRTPFPYYDVAVFHEEDTDIADLFVKNEMMFFYNNYE